MIQIKHSGVSISDKAQIEDLKQEFAETNCLVLPEFIEPTIAKRLLERVETTNFVTKYEISDKKEFGKTLFVPEDEPILFTFHLLMNNLKLFQLIEQITNCESIGNFTGRMHRSEPAENHAISWHGDNSNDRLIGMTLELSSKKYEGGKFQLRETGSDHILREIGDIKAGDAFLFRISPDLQHRLTPVESGGSRTVGVGWFCSKPDWQSFAQSYFQRFKTSV